MSVEKFAVVFDTNSYRQLVTGKSTETVLSEITDIRKQELYK